MAFGKNLQFLRKLTGMTQEELAEKMNISRQTVSKWELDSAYPEIDKLLGLSKLFSCSIDQMLCGDMDYNNEAYLDIEMLTVEPFFYISYAVISEEPEEDALAHVGRWAESLNMENPVIIGWDFPHISQEQENKYHMHGYSAALVFNDNQDIGNIQARIIKQDKQKYIKLTLKEVKGEEFVLIPNAYKYLMAYMDVNGIKGKHDSSVISCYEHEYFIDEDKYMDIYIAVE